MKNKILKIIAQCPFFANPQNISISWNSKQVAEKLIKLSSFVHFNRSIFPNVCFELKFFA